MNELLEKTERLRNAMIDYVTNYTIEKNPSEQTRLKNLYLQLRSELLKSEIAPLLPHSVRTHDTLAGFNRVVKSVGGYDARKNFIEDEFEPVIEKLKGNYASVVDASAAEALEELGLEHIQTSWARALSRIHDEPSGAITLARTMLESLYKSLLDRLQVEYDDGADFPKLHRLVTEQFDFTPEQQTNQSIKTITGNIQNIVGQIAFLRNNSSDAHGQGQDYVQPSSEVAEVVVNLAGSLAILLVRLYQKKSK